MADREYMTSAELAELIRTPVPTLRYWRQIGTGPRSMKLGRRVLYPTQGVRAWLADAESRGVGGALSAR